MQVNPHIITLYYIIQLYICIYALLNKSYQKTCRLGIQVMWLNYLLKPQKQCLIWKRERERLHVTTDGQCSCLLGSVLGPVGTVLPDIFVLTFPKVFW
jgi:hypothetical protein